MKERPILFSAPMVRAILEGRKTQTRRVVKWKPRESGLNLSFSGLHLGFYNEAAGARSGWVLRSRGGGGRWNDRTHPLHCPYGAPGDRLWAREAFSPYRKASESSPIVDATYALLADGTHVRRDGSVWPGLAKYAPGAFDGIRWRPSIHMPRWASRITLEVTGVRVERLQDITEEDARAEGVERYADDGVTYYGPLNRGHALATVAFERLWLEINGAESWDANPWVWVVEFKRIEAQERAA